MIRVMALAALVGVSLSGLALAEEGKKENKQVEERKDAIEEVIEDVVQKDAEQAEAKKKIPPNPVQLWLDAEKKLLEPLAEEERESIFILRNKHAIIRVIDVVERDIGNAVKSCGAENSALKKPMETRFKEWKDAVKPITSTAQKNLKRDIDRLKIVKPAQLRRVLDLNDKAFEYSDQRTVKTPVSSEAACQRLMASMDRTEDNMIKLLQETLLPESVIKSRAARAQDKDGSTKDKEKAGKEAKASKEDKKEKE